MKNKWLVSLLLLATSASAQDSYFYAAIGLGDNSNLSGQGIQWEDKGGIGSSLEFGYVKRLNSSWEVAARWVHISQLDVGPPFNDIEESSVDHFGVRLLYKWSN